MTRFVSVCAAVVMCAAIASVARSAEPASNQPESAVEVLSKQATALHGFVESDLAVRFLDAVPSLPTIAGTRVAYRNRVTRDAISESGAEARGESALEEYERLEMDETFYYFTRYGSPLAFVRPLDLIARAGLSSLDGKRVVDFGFGSIGQLRLMGMLGATAHGIEVDALLDVLYSRPGDTGAIARHLGAGEGNDGEIVLHFGRFPAEPALVSAVGGEFDAFISKNTLKNGYVHPAEEVDPRMLVDLGVDDEVFVGTVHTMLRAGGYLMIYNLSPPQSEERYIPWADGRSPFPRELLERVGFEVIAFDRDDTAAARDMGARLGWGDQMNLETDLFGTYTLVRKR